VAESKLRGMHDLCDNAPKLSLGEDFRPVRTVVPE
jgi:hypothetical protein